MSYSKTNICSMCGDMVAVDCRECPRCGEVLQKPPKPSNLWNHAAMATRWRPEELNLIEKPTKRDNQKINTCPVCGDMVKAEWEKCSRCGEPLNGRPSVTDQRPRVRMSINRKAAIHLAENSPKRKRTNACPTCGDIVKTGWGECPRCGESLEQVMAFPSLWYENPVTANKEIVQSRVDESTNKSVKIGACTLCGDMVKEDWKECPRCGEAL